MNSYHHEKKAFFILKNWMVGVVFGLYCLAAPITSAASMRYSYEGNNYELCGGIYCTGGPYHLSASFVTNMTLEQLRSLPFSNITGSITSYTFSDETGLVVTRQTPTAYTRIEMSTDASGIPLTWEIGGYANTNGVTNIQLQTNWDTYYSFHPGADFSETTASFAGDFGFVSGNPGVWTVTAVPEPNTYAMLIVGLGVLERLFRRRRGAA